jgi:hypothetical protein
VMNKSFSFIFIGKITFFFAKINILYVINQNICYLYEIVK